MFILSRRLALASFAVVALLCAHASAATIKWNSAADGNWNTAANWSPPQVPGASDYAVINFPGTYSVTLDVNTTVLGLCVGGPSGVQTLAISANTLTLNGPSLIDTNGRIAQSGSTFDITTNQNTFLENKGTIDWSGGTISTGFIENRGAFNILPGATAKVLASSLQITNDGTMTWSGNTPLGDFDMRNDSNIFSTGQINITGNATVTTTTPGFEGVITANGTMKKLVGAGMTTVDKIIFDVNGVLEVDTGILYFTTKINPILPGGTTLKHGTYIVKAELRLTSANIDTFNNNANVTLDGASAVIHDETGITNALAALTQLDGGSSLTLKNVATLTCASTLSVDGKVAVSGGSTLNLGTSSTYTQNSAGTTVLNSGTIIADTFSNGGFIYGNGTLQGAVTNTGLISPGSAPSSLGTISITGALSNSGGTVAVKAMSMSQVDSLSVGASALDGTLNVTLINGYKPNNGDNITVVTGAPTTNGFFSTTTLSGAALLSLSQGINSNNLKVTFNAAPQALWVGTTSTSWNNSSNWSPPSVPNSAALNVHIPATAPNFPVLDGSFACRDLLIDGGTGTHLDMATFNLTVNGNLQTSSAIASTGGGNLILNGAENNSLESLGVNGSICRTSITAAYKVADSANSVFNGPVTVASPTGRLVLNNAKVTINGDYAQTGSGLLIMQNTSDGLTIVGNASFSGGNETGLLTAGLLEIQGTLTTGATAHSFDAFAPHITRFTGASSFSNPTFNQFYGNLEIGTASTSANLQFSADSHITGNVFLTKGTATTSSGTITVTIDANLFDPPGGNWLAANTVFTSLTPTLPPSIQSNVTFAPTGVAVLPLGFTIAGTNNLTVLAGQLDLNGNLVVVGNDFLTSGTGSLQSFNQAGELSVLHDVKFSGGDEKGQLLAGRIRVKHDFITLDNGEGAAFNADLIHVVTFDGTTPQTLNFFVATEAFQNLEINGASTSVTQTSDVIVTGGFKLLAGSYTLAASKTLTLNNDGYGQAAGSLVLNGSSQINSGSPFQIFGGTVGGIGSINAAVTNTGGTVAPGLSGSTNEGTLSMTSYVQGPGGALNVRVNTPLKFDQLSASSASLAGTLNIGLDGYSGNLSDTFHIVAGAVSGTFTTVNGASINATFAFDTQYTVGNVKLVVLQKPQITNATLTATARVGQAFSGFTVLTSGSPTIVVTSSPLPSGLTLSSGVISGTPLAGSEGIANITLTATNSAGVDNKTLVLTINRIPAFTSAASATSTINQPVSITLAATGFPTPVFAALSALPAGLSLSGNTISGTPTSAGVTTISLQASNSVGADTQSFQFTSTVSGPPVIVSLASSLNPSQTGSSVTFTAVATQPDGAPLTFTWDFQDGSATATGNPVQHIFTIENTFAVTCTASDGSNTVQSSLNQQALAPSSGGGGVPNITQGTTPVTDPLSGLTINVAGSDGGVLTFAIDVNSLTRDAFSVSTDFQSIGGRSDAVAGTTVVHKFTDPGVYVATSTATETATQTLKGKARKTVVISSLETGTPPKFTKKPLKTVIGVTAIKGNFAFNRNSDGSSPQFLADSVAVARAASAKPDVVTMTGSIELPEGLDLSQTQDFSFGIGNIIDQLSVTSKGKGVLPSALKRIKSLTIKYPKLDKGSTLTKAGQIAKFTISYSQAGLSAAGFDADGITGTLKAGESAKSTLTRTIQVAMTFAGQTWEVQAPVQFKVSAKGDGGTISGRSGGQ